jgi:hypothetical protein
MTRARLIWGCYLPKKKKKEENLGLSHVKLYTTYGLLSTESTEYIPTLVVYSINNKQRHPRQRANTTGQLVYINDSRWSPFLSSSFAFIQCNLKAGSIRSCSAAAPAF